LLVGWANNLISQFPGVDYFSEENLQANPGFG